MILLFGNSISKGGLLFVLSAPSGTGKSTVIKEVRLRIDKLGYCVSHTTRNPRPGEKDGVHYHFVTQSRFKEMIDKGAFVEWATVYGEYYGTAVDSLQRELDKGVDVILDVDPVGAQNIRKRFADAVLIFLIPPSLKVLEQRLRGRGTDSTQTIAKRLEKAVSEVKESVHYDYIVINDDLETTVGDVISIIRAERCKTTRRLEVIKTHFQL